MYNIRKYVIFISQIVKSRIDSWWSPRSGLPASPESHEIDLASQFFLTPTIHEWCPRLPFIRLSPEGG